MTQHNPFIVLLFILFCFTANAQSIDSLRNRLEHIIQTKNAVVGVSIMGMDGKDTLSIYGNRRFPMQSVFKFHIGLAMLSAIDQKQFSLDQLIKIEKNELLSPLWSPIREKYSEGTTLTIAEILEFTVSQSDNAGCDALLRLLGGPLKVEEYIMSCGIKDISIKINEEVMQNHWDRQFENWTTPKAANQTLATFFNNLNNVISPSSYNFIWRIMQETSTGKDRLKGKLPQGTIVAHKTGWSGRNKTTGITAAVNDIGIVFLPDGKYFYISVFITESYEDAATNEEIIADISKAAWDYFRNKNW
ncbi:MAG TPA: class A beta-lactamase, subclass A2 [Saprospiraceae bacterium]|nr:class A beta-lactamase, subclass A2 [Saprospiraceae bacterium]